MPKYEHRNEEMNEEKGQETFERIYLEAASVITGAVFFPDQPIYQNTYIKSKSSGF